MAKVTGPLFSFGASGSIAGALTFNQSTSAAVARRFPRGYKPPTGAQVIQRAAMADAAASWRSLDAITRAKWIALSASRAHTAFSKYFLEWTAQASTPAQPPYLPVA